MELMGVLNTTPDSFSDGGRYLAVDAAVAHGLRLAAEGADWVDVGGESTRPGAVPVPPEEELRRVLPVVAALAAHGVAVSVDTVRAATARAALDAGAAMINDVSGGTADTAMRHVVADSAARYVVMHSAGPSARVERHDDVVAAVVAELARRVDAAVAAGVPRARIVVDPGLGFSKTAADDWALLRRLDALAALGAPVLVGASRKRFVRSAAGPGADEAALDAATATISVAAARVGAWGVRVHAVGATRAALAVDAALRGGAAA